MITVHHLETSRSQRILWLLEELGLGYTLKMLPFPPRLVRQDFLDENPLGTVPLLIDGQTRMSESAAICEYLAARHAPNPLHVAADDAAFGAYLNFLHFGEATLTFPQTLVLRYTRFEPEERRLPQAVDDRATDAERGERAHQRAHGARRVVERALQLRLRAQQLDVAFKRDDVLLAAHGAILPE